MDDERTPTPDETKPDDEPTPSDADGEDAPTEDGFDPAVAGEGSTDGF